MQTRSFCFLQPLSLDSWYSCNILGPFYFPVFIDYSCWSVTLWLSSLQTKRSKGALCLQMTFWSFYVVPSSAQYVSKIPITFTSPTQFLRIWDMNIFMLMVMQILDCKFWNVLETLPRKDILGFVAALPLRCLIQPIKENSLLLSNDHILSHLWFLVLMLSLR